MSECYKEGWGSEREKQVFSAGAGVGTMVASFCWAIFSTILVGGWVHSCSNVEQMKKEAEKYKMTERVHNGCIWREGERLNGLCEKVLRKAEMYDGKPGLSFEEQVEMANKLGYENIIREGEIVGLEVEGGKGPNHQDYFVWLRVGKKQRYKVDEKKLEDYLENGGKGR